MSKFERDPSKMGQPKTDQNSKSTFSNLSDNALPNISIERISLAPDSTATSIVDNNSQIISSEIPVSIKKTRRTQQIEKRLGKPIEFILEEKYIDEKKGSPTIAKEIRVSSSTADRWLRAWLKVSGSKMRSRDEAVRIVFSDPEKMKRFYRRPKKMRTKIAESMRLYHARRKGLDQQTSSV